MYMYLIVVVQRHLVIRSTCSALCFQLTTRTLLGRTQHGWQWRCTQYSNQRCPVVCPLSKLNVSEEFRNIATMQLQTCLSEDYGVLVAELGTTTTSLNYSTSNMHKSNGKCKRSVRYISKFTNSQLRAPRFHLFFFGVSCAFLVTCYLAQDIGTSTWLD